MYANLWVGVLVSEWWTYTLSDFLLFSPRTYLRLLELYNLAIWPLQILALALGVATLALIGLPSCSALRYSRSGRPRALMRGDEAWQRRWIAAIVAACWIWVAWAFHLQRYATINWAATYFAAAFAIEALLIAGAGIVRGRLTFRSERPLSRRPGLYVFLFALVAQPAIEYALRPSAASIEYFGVAPDPTVVATLGVLLLATSPAPWWLLVIPLLWCAVSGAIQWTLDSPNALVTPFMGSLVLAVWAARMAGSRRDASSRAQTCQRRR